MFILWTLHTRTKPHEIRFKHDVEWNRVTYTVEVDGKALYEESYRLWSRRLPFEIPVVLDELPAYVLIRKSRNDMTAELYLEGILIPAIDTTKGWEAGNPFDTH